MKVLSLPNVPLVLNSLVSPSEKSPVIPHFNPNRKIALPTMEGFSFERVHQIVNLEAKGNYTCLHFLDGREVLVCKTLRDMENQLADDRQFVRIHRSYTINLNHLQKYVKGKGGYVIMENGANINVSTGKKQLFLSALNGYFGG